MRAIVSDVTNDDDELHIANAEPDIDVDDDIPGMVETIRPIGDVCHLKDSRVSSVVDSDQRSLPTDDELDQPLVTRYSSYGLLLSHDH